MERRRVDFFHNLVKLIIIFYGERPLCLRKWGGFCVFFGLNCKKELNITLFLHFFVLLFAHKQKSYYLCNVKINQPLKTFEL